MSARTGASTAGARGSRPDPSRGVFETMLVVHGGPVELSAHLGRLERSVATLYGEALPPGARELVGAETQGLELGRVRLEIVPDEGGRPRAHARSQAVDRGIVFPAWEAGVTLAPLALAGGLGAHKWVDRAFLDEAEARTESVALVVDADETVLEASRANVFVVRDGIVATPTADGRILPGVTRARAVDVLRDLGVACVERDVALAELVEADEVFLTGSVRGVEPVRGYEPGRSWRQGAVAPRLAGALARRWGVR